MPAEMKLAREKAEKATSAPSTPTTEVVPLAGMPTGSVASTVSPSPSLMKR